MSVVLEGQLQKPESIDSANVRNGRPANTGLATSLLACTVHTHLYLSTGCTFMAEGVSHGTLLVPFCDTGACVCGWVQLLRRVSCPSSVQPSGDHCVCWIHKSCELSAGAVIMTLQHR